MLRSASAMSRRDSEPGPGGRQTIEDRGRIIGELVLALESATMPTVDVTIVGTPDDEQAQALLKAALRRFDPRAVIELSPPGERYPSPGGPAVFLCTATACSSPIENPAELDAKATAFTVRVLQ